MLDDDEFGDLVTNWSQLKAAQSSKAVWMIFRLERFHGGDELGLEECARL